MRKPKLGPRQRLLVLLVATVLILLRHGGNPVEIPPERFAGSDIERAIQSRTKQIWVEAAGQVIRVLPDDTAGVIHQRFILRLPSGHTVLVAHNIALASRAPVQVGEAVQVRGRYEWNAEGGVIHWTHHDPGNSLSGGWIEHNAIRYR